MRIRIRLLQIVISVIIYNLTITAFSWCFKLVTDSLINEKFQLFYRYICLSVIVVIVQAISNYMYIKGKNVYIKDVIIKKKLGFVEAIFNYDINKFQQREISEYQSFMFHDLNIYEQKIIAGKFDIFEKILLLFLSGTAIFIIAPKFVLLVIVLMGISIGIPLLFGRYAGKYNSRMSNSCTKAMDKLDEMLNGFVLLRTFSMERKGITECNDAIACMETDKTEYKSIMAIFQSVLILMTTILTLTIFVWGGKAVISGEITVGELIALIQLLFNVANPLMGIMMAISNVKAAKPLAKKYEQFITEKRNDGKKQFSLEKSIKLEYVSFNYSEDNVMTLNNISCQFEKNKKYAIVGENGSGKSTLLKLIAGVTDLKKYQGKILIDYAERKELQDISFWNNVAYIPQDVFLFKKTLMENIFLNERSNISEEFHNLVDKLDIQKLLEKDSKLKCTEYEELSGGEKQKIAFLREMLKQSSVILADEPDAALDLDAGSSVLEILSNVEKTCIVVTHRISDSLAKFDEILVLKNGELVEKGEYYQLIEKGGYFSEMFQ